MWRRSVLGHRVRGDARDRPEGGQERNRRQREDDARVGSELADRVVDRAHVGCVLGDGRHPELVPVGIEHVGGHRPPEHLAGRLVVPHLGETEREDEHVGLFEHVEGGQPNRFVVLVLLGSVSVPEAGGRRDAAEGPVELLADRVAVDHPLLHLDDVRVRIRLGEDVVVALVQVVPDVLGEAAAERGHLHLRRDERFGRQPTVEDELLDRVLGAHVRDGGTEVAVVSAKPHRGR